MTTGISAERHGLDLDEIGKRQHRRLRMGGFPTALATFVPQALALLHRQQPEVLLVVIDDRVQGLLPRLLRRELDVAVVFDDAVAPNLPDLADELQLSPPSGDPYRLLVPRSHRWARENTATEINHEDLASARGATPTPAWRRHVARPGGLLSAAVGTVLLCFALGGADWYGPANGLDLDVNGMRTAAVLTQSRFAEVMFNGGGWMLVTLSAIVAASASTCTGKVTVRVLRACTALTAIVGSLLSLIAVQDLIYAARRAGETVTGVFDDTRSGLFLMLIGFGLIAASAAIPSRSPRAHWRRSGPQTEDPGGLAVPTTYDASTDTPR